MRYPVIVMCVIVAAIGVLTMFVIPKFAPLFKQLGDNIPWPTLAIMSVSSFAQEYWYVVVGAVGARACSALRRYVRTENGRLRWDTLQAAPAGHRQAGARRRRWRASPARCRSR